MKTEPIQNRCPKCAAPLPENAPQGLCPKCLLAGVAAPTEAGQSQEHHPLPSLEAVAAAFPNLDILEQVGRGGMGVVFKARQPRLDRLVALKLLPLSLAADSAFTERFNREARVLARLNHPNIVTVHDFGQAGGFFFLLMEFVDGVNLRQAMQRGKFSPAQALSLVPKICEALQFAHDEGILHRDIKPENILLDAKGRVKIADFGIAKLVGEPFPVTKLTATGAAVGTPNYMAPEQIEHPEDVDQRADIYSLGVVFYEMLTGELPIGRFAAPSEKTPVDPRVDEVVFRSLEREREKRFHSASEVKTRVENIRSTPPPTQTAMPTPEPSSPASAPAAAMTAAPELEAVRNQVAPVATALFILGIVNCLPILGVGLSYFAALAGKSPGGQVFLSKLAVTLLVPFALGLMSGVFMMAAARMLRRMASRELAVLACIVATIPPLSPAFLIGIPIAVWGLMVLGRPEVKAAFASPTMPPPLTLLPPAPARRWSMKAILGTMLAGIGLFPPLLMVAIAFFLAIPVDHNFSMLNPRIQFLFGIALSLLPGFAGTLLGAFALSDIRRSVGRLRGRSLAFCAMLFWPLLVLDILVGFVVLVGGRFLGSHGAGMGGVLMLFPLALLAALGLDLLLAVRVWRWATNRDDPSPGQRRSPVPAVTVLCVSLVLVIACLGFVLSVWMPMLAQTNRVSGPPEPIVDSEPVLPVESRRAQEKEMEVTVPPQQRFTGTWTVFSNNVPVIGPVLVADLATPAGEASKLKVQWRVFDSSGPEAKGPPWDLILWVAGTNRVVSVPAPGSFPNLEWTVRDAEQYRRFTPSIEQAFISEIFHAEPHAGSQSHGNWSVRLTLRSSVKPQLGTVTNGIGAEFTVPAGQVAVFEIVTRSKGQTVPIRNLGAYVIAPADRMAEGIFRFTRDAEDNSTGVFRRPWRIEIGTGGGLSSSGGLDLPAGLDLSNSALGLGLALSPDREIVQWGLPAEEHLPADGLVGLRVRTQAHGLKPGTPGSAGASGTGTNWLGRAATSIPGRTDAPGVQPGTKAASATTDSQILRTRGVDAEFILLGGQVAIFEIVTRSNGVVTPVPNLSAYLLARDGEPTMGRFRWVPDPEDPDGMKKPWCLELTQPNGSRSAGSSDLPPQLAKAPGTIALRTRLERDWEFLEWAGSGNGPYPSIGLRIRTQAHGLKGGLSAAATGTTNWQEVARRK